MAQITTATPMPVETMQLLEWLESVIREVTMGDQDDVRGWSEADLINCLDRQELKQWQEIPRSVRLAMLAYVTEELVDKIGEEAYHRYHCGE